MWFASLNRSMNERHSPFYSQLEPNVNFVLEYPYVNDGDFTNLQFDGLG